MIYLIASLVIAAIAFMIILSQRQSVTNAKRLLHEAQERNVQLEQKFTTSRDELRKAKDELDREKTALRDARDLNKKKLRRLANADSDQNLPESEAVYMSNKAFDDSQKAMQALEAQIEQMKKEQSLHDEALRAQLSSEIEEKSREKARELDELKKKNSELLEEVKKQKRLMRPEGHKIDLKSLTDDVASEFARVFRKAEQHERLHGIARAKLHLAQEKFTELQKRYFSVCRELAVMSGSQSNVEPQQARDIAEKMVAEHQEGFVGHHSDNHATNNSNDADAVSSADLSRG